MTKQTWPIVASLLVWSACKEGGLPACPTDTIPDSNGLCRATCAADNQCLSNERCDPTAHICVPRSEPPPPPRIKTFSVTPQVITMADQLVSFEYEVENADEVEITPGALARTNILRQTISLNVEDTTTFTLTAFGDAGMTSQEQTVVLEGGSVGIVQFFAVPDFVKGGDPVTFMWSVRNAAPGSIRITDPYDRPPRVVADSLQPEGMHTEFARNLPVEYWLEAQGIDGQIARASTRVMRVLEGPPQITSLEAVPSMIRPLDTAIVRWETRDARSVIFRDPLRQPYFSVDLFEAQRGVRLVAPLEPTTYTLQASGDGSVESTVAVDVRGPSLPAINSVGVEPPRRTPGNQGMTVTASWDVVNATEIKLYHDGQYLDSVAPSGSRSLPATMGNMSFDIVADNDGTVAEKRFTSWLVIGEEEPNGATASADPIADVARSGLLSNTEVSADTDTFRLLIPEDGGSIVARLENEDAANGCSGLETVVMVLLDPNGNDVRAMGTVGQDGCQELEAHHLARGVYFVRLQAMMMGVEVRSYVLLVDSFGATCGDGVKEGNESCDDHNRSAGDGCDGYCQEEPPFEYDVEIKPSTVMMDLRPPVPVTPVILNATPGSSGSKTIALPFTFEFFGRRYQGMIVHANGYLSFRPEPEDVGPPASFPDASAPNAVIAPFWSDLVLANFPSAKGEIYYWTTRGDEQLNLIFHNLTGRGHTEQDHVLLDALVRLDRQQRTVMIVYGRLSSTGDVSGLQVFAGIEDEKGGKGYAVPGCDPMCSGESMLAEQVVTFTPRMR